jgi:hypothetical protein
MVVAVANARQMVPAPVRQARRFGLLSVADKVDSGEMHWMLGGLIADGELCSKPSAGTINACTPTAAKASNSWYADLQGDPWLAYMYETCKTIGRFAESSDRLRTRFLAAEDSAVEAGFQTAVLSAGTTVGTGAFPTVAAAIGALEANASQEYGGQVILHLPGLVAAEAVRAGIVQRFGSRLETVTGSLVVAGNYKADADGGSLTVPALYATGAVVLYRSELAESGQVYDFGANKNDYYTLVERAYSALVDCFRVKATATLCGCGGA